jgi:hypothetical protein
MDQYFAHKAGFHFVQSDVPPHHLWNAGPPHGK